MHHSTVMNDYNKHIIFVYLNNCIYLFYITNQTISNPFNQGGMNSLENASTSAFPRIFKCISGSLPIAHICRGKKFIDRK